MDTEPDRESEGPTQVETPGGDKAVAHNDEMTAAAPKAELVRPPPRGGAEPDDDRISFSDLVRAHWAWENELYEREHERRGPGPRKSIDSVFRDSWSRFERRYGQIVDAYWSVRDASAVALTIRFKRVRGWRDSELIPRFHRATDWATRDEPEIAETLDECETLAVRVEEILRGPSEMIALRRIHAVASHILGFVDREWGRHPSAAETRSERREAPKLERDAFVARQRAELKRIEDFYNQAGNQQARILFFWGMAQGLLALILLTSLTVILAWSIDSIDGGKPHWAEQHLFIICVIAGALGAILSVLSRMASLTGKFALDHEVGRKNLRWIGIYRPLVGGIFGIATFLMLASGILQTQSPGGGKDFAYYGILALFSGFFERFTKLSPTGAPTPVEGAKDEKET